MDYRSKIKYSPESILWAVAKMVLCTKVLVDKNGNRYLVYSYWNDNRWIVNVNRVDNDWNDNDRFGRLGNSLHSSVLCGGSFF